MKGISGSNVPCLLVVDDDGRLHGSVLRGYVLAAVEPYAASHDACNLAINRPMVSVSPWGPTSRSRLIKPSTDP